MYNLYNIIIILRAREFKKIRTELNESKDEDRLRKEEEISSLTAEIMALKVGRMFNSVTSEASCLDWGSAGCGAEAKVNWGRKKGKIATRKKSSTWQNISFTIQASRKKENSWFSEIKYPIKWKKSFCYSIKCLTDVRNGSRKLFQLKQDKKGTTLT